MYPLQFRPNTTCATYLNSGALSKITAPCQIFRPMLSLEFNGLPANWDRQSQPGACLLRFAIADSAFANQFVGPPHWQQIDMPYFILSEDVNNDIWDVTDALRWTSSPDDILAGFASKRLPTQDGSALTLLPAGGGAASFANPEIHFGRVYLRSFPAGADEWYNLYPQPGQAFDYMTLSETIPGPAYVTVRGYDGTVQNPNLRWNTGGGASVAVPFPFTAFSSGPIHYVNFSNTTGVDSNTVFTIGRSLLAQRKI